MITVHARQHEFGPKEPRIRLWKDGDTGFVVVPLHDAEAFHDMLDFMGLGHIKFHHLDCDANKDCDCLVVAKNETIKQHLG
jgi:hypothetical protein